jgi:hypothetical protein
LDIDIPLSNQAETTNATETTTHVLINTILQPSSSNVHTTRSTYIPHDRDVPNMDDRLQSQHYPPRRALPFESTHTTTDTRLFRVATTTRRVVHARGPSGWE